MIRGIFCLEYAKRNTDFIIFKCPHCKEDHSIDVITGESYEKQSGWCVWHYELSETVGNKSKMIITPSFDASEYCGYYGPFNWEVESIVLPPNQYRNDETEAWMIDLLQILKNHLDFFS